jgi:hypothetical protein
MQPENKNQKQQLELQVATAFKHINYNEKYYTVLLRKENFIGTTPIKNIYMMNNILRYKNINTVKILIDDKKSMPKFTYKYNEFEGKTLMHKQLNKLDKTNPIMLHSLHPSIPKNEDNGKNKNSK